MKKTLLFLALLLNGLIAMATDNTVDIGGNILNTRYTNTAPDSNWYATGFNDRSWQKYQGTMDYPEYGEFWIRQEIIITDNPSNHTFTLKIQHDDDAIVYINGKEVYSANYCQTTLTTKDISSSFLKKGRNIIAYYVKDPGGVEQYLHAYFTAETEGVITSGPNQTTLYLNNSLPELYITDVDSLRNSQASANVITPTGEIWDASTISWASLNPEVATVEDGKIYAVSAGKAIITVTARTDTLTLTDSIEIEVKNSTINLNAHKASLYVVDREGLNNKSLTSTISPTPLADVPVEWASSDTAVATVVDGQVKAVGAGTAIITATAVVSGITISDSLSLSVNAAQEDTRYVFVETAGMLSSLISTDEKYDITSLVVGGELNSSDMAFLKDMAGRDGSGNVSAGSLRRLDMQTATLASGAEVNFNSCGSLMQVAVPENTKTLPAYAFQSCSNLKNVELNDGLTKIGYQAFYSCSNLTEITIPSTVTSIDYNVFQYDSKLETVNIPEDSKLNTIGEWAFSYCNALKSIYIPKGVTEIPYACFLSNSSLQSVKFAPDSKLKTINGSAFADCGKLEEIHLPESVTSIGNEAFEGCYSLAVLDIPANSSLKSIGSEAFKGCPIKEVNLPASLVTINNSAFQSCRSLTTVTTATDSRLASIGGSAFSGCDKLTAFALPWRTATVSENAFWGCSSLAEFTIPENSRLTTLGTDALNDTRIQQLYIPAGLSSIDGTGYQNSNLREITANTDNPNYLTKDGVLYDKSTGALIAFPQSKSGAWVTPSFLTSLPASALQNCSQISSITLSAEIDSIGAGALGGCTGLKSLLVQTANVPQTATDAFSGVGKGTTLVFVPSEAVDTYKADETWGTFRMLQAFPTEAYIYLSDSTLTLYDTQSPEPRQKDLSAIVITPQGASDAQITWTTSNDSVITVSDGHVELLQPGTATITASALVGDTTIFSTCSVLGVGFEAGQSVYYIATPGTLTDVIPQAERDTITNLKLFGYINGTDLREIRRMAGGEFNNYDTNTNAQLTILDLGDVIIRSGGDSYCTGNIYGLSNWQHYTGDNSVDGVMFHNCWKLEKVVLPQTLVTLGNATFAECNNLQSVTMPENITNIPDYTFSGCSKLTEINNLDWASLDSINNYAFSGCTSLQSIGDLSACTTIKNNAFSGCTSLQHIGDLSACTTIKNNAFSGCTSLQHIGDLSACISIGDFAFSNCTSLQSIGDLSACTSIGDYVFDKCDSLKSIRINEVKSIGDQAFRRSGIEEIRIMGITPAALGYEIIDENKQVVVVPAAALETYRTAHIWNSFYQNIVPDDAQLDITATVKAEDGGSGILTAVGDKALSYATHLTLKGSINSYDFMLFRNKMPNLHYLDLTETTIEANPYEFVTGCYTEVNRLPKHAFENFSKLLEIKLPNSITYIGVLAFSGCSNLRTVKTYPGIVTVDQKAFSDCTSLKEISFGKGLSGINDEAFCACPLDSIVIPSTVTEIGSYAFYQCRELKYISLSKNLTKINGGTFADCSSLQSIVLPSKVTSIDGSAFSGCSSLKELRIPPMVETIGGSAFSGCSIKDIYVYVANSKDVAINQNTFSCWSTATLHVPDFATASYYWNTQWSQFVNITEFSDTYESFYTKNDITLDSETGTIKGTPDATLHEESGLIVNDDEKQDLGDVELIHDGENGASVIPEKEGNITANRARIRIHVTANRWHFFCFPFDIDLDSLQYDGQYVWRQYDGLRRSRREGGWQNLPEGTTKLSKWRGYIFQGTTTGDLVLTVIKPDFTSKDVDSHLEVYTSDNAVDASWNFVGNPYQSYYSIDQTSYDAPITVWTGNGYEAYRPGDDDYEFSPYQAFFVQTSEDNDAVGFRAGSRESYLESQQSLAKARAFRSAQYVKPDRLLFNLTLTHQGDSTYTDRTRIVFNDRKSLAYEVGCDAAKFFSTQRSAELFSTDAQGTQYSINERPVGEGRVDLSLVVNKAGTYSICGERMDAPALLIDNLTGVSHDLTLGAYEFSAQEGTLSNRFTLVLRDDLTGIESITSKTGAQISLHNGVSISGVDSGVQTRLFSIDGRIVGSITGQGNIAAPAGIYILKVGAMSTKVKVE